MAKKKKKIYDYTIYTDGGCSFNPGGTGGCAAVVIDEKTKERTEVSDAFLSTTNNRMEIMAAVIGIRAVKKGASIRLYTDSQYLLKCFSGEWSRKKNVDLWNKLDKAACGKKVRMVWVRGHSGNKWNERCDKLATSAMNSAHKVDKGYLEDLKRKKEEGAAFYKKLDEARKSGSVGSAMDRVISVSKKDNLPVGEIMSPSKYAKAHKTNLSCARAIVEFYLMGKSGFSAYVDLRVGGRDYWSTRKISELSEMISSSQFDTIRRYVSDDVYVASCIRWHLRGLKLEDAIRKTLVDIEVAQNTK